jgi:hypothetical protein
VLLLLVLLFVVLPATGCGDLIMPAEDDGGDNGGDDETDDAGLDADGALPPVVDAYHHVDSNMLHVVAFEASPQQIGPGQSTTFTVIVSDDLGVGDISAARLVDDSGAMYSTFPATGGFMRSVTLTYTQITSTRPLAPSTMRTFVAAFADRQGFTATASVVVSLAGAPAGDGGVGGSDGGGTGGDAAIDARSDATVVAPPDASAPPADATGG